MALTPSSVNPGVSSEARSTEAQFHVVKKRNRVPLSCNPCRTRKKCDRNHPCNNCVRREGADVSSCIYVASPSLTQNRSRRDLTPEDMQTRIGRLEDLILALMRGESSTDVSDGAGVATVAKTVTVDEDHEATIHSRDVGGLVDKNLDSSLGLLKIDVEEGKSNYIGEEHWHTILSEISEVRAYLGNHEKELENSHHSSNTSKPAKAKEGLTFLHGAVPPTSDIELRAELPPMSTILTLCLRYFNSADNLILIVHPPSFQQQLQRHWQDPSKTPIMWIGLLYSILCLAMLSYHRFGDEPVEWAGQTLRMASVYRLRTVQCMITANYTKPVENTVETMLLYVLGEYSSQLDVDLGVLLIVSLATKIAFQMGYHRDAKWFPSLTPFQGEMRRRTWALLRMVDVMFSHQFSLPNSILSHQCDTQVPTNLFYEDFGPETQALPPSRPHNEHTPTAYMIAKVKLCKEMSEILQTTNRVGNPISYEEILGFDARLREIYQDFPSHLQVAPLEGCRDPVTIIMARFSINALYLKIICLLHKRYVPLSRDNPQYAYSRRRAVTAASETLQNLCTLHHESNETEAPKVLKWFVNSMATKEFLVSAMLVALDLHCDCVAELSDDQSVVETALFWTMEQRMEMLSNLEMTKDFWKGLADNSTDAKQASNVLEIMLEKIRNPAATPETTRDTGIECRSQFSRVSTLSNELPEHTTSMTLDPTSTDMVGKTVAAVHGAQAFNAPSAVDFSRTSFSSNVMPDIGEAQGDTSEAGSSLPIFPNFMAYGDFSESSDWSAFEHYTQTASWGWGDTFPSFPGSLDTEGSGN